MSASFSQFIFVDTACTARISSLMHRLYRLGSVKSEPRRLQISQLFAKSVERNFGIESHLFWKSH